MIASALDASGSAVLRFFEFTLLASFFYFGNINCTWARICQFAPKSGFTTL